MPIATPTRGDPVLAEIAMWRDRVSGGIYKYIYYIYTHTSEEDDRVVENIGCVIIVIINFFYQDIIEFFSYFLYIRQPEEFFNVI